MLTCVLTPNNVSILLIYEFMIFVLALRSVTSWSISSTILANFRLFRGNCEVFLEVTDESTNPAVSLEFSSVLWGNSTYFNEEKCISLSVCFPLGEEATSWTRLKLKGIACVCLSVSEQISSFSVRNKFKCFLNFSCSLMPLKLISLQFLLLPGREAFR